MACAATPSATDWASLLPAYRWQLVTATDGRQQRIAELFPQTDRQLMLSFEPDGRIGIRGGCNQMGGAYSVSPNGALAVSQLMATRMACAPALMQADVRISALVAQPVQLSLEQATPDGAPRLQLTNGSQTRLVFVGQPTAENRYGGPASLVFIEVAAQRVACSRPPMPNATCLQVRERSYDAQGRASGTPGPWQPLYGEIEGYSHTEGMRNVLRVKKFQRSSPVPADASSTRLVLDMVIESEATPP